MRTLTVDDERLIRRLLEAYELTEFVDQILSNSAKCYALSVDDRDDYSAVGNTRFGGDPDLPEDFTWPSVESYAGPRYANFIGQINFAELPPLTAGSPLPQDGLLSVFVTRMDGASVPVSLSAHYFTSRKDLARRETPSEDELCDEYLVNLEPQRIIARPAISVRACERQFVAALEAHRQGLSFWEFTSDLMPRDAIGQLLGFATAGDIRENLYRQVALAQLGEREFIYSDYWESVAEYEEYIEKYRDSSSMYESYLKMRPGVEWLSANRDLVRSEAEAWRLLWKMDSNDAMNLHINDSDPLYVFVRQQDLAARDFSRLAGEVTQG